MSGYPRHFLTNADWMSRWKNSPFSKMQRDCGILQHVHIVWNVVHLLSVVRGPVTSTTIWFTSIDFFKIENSRNSNSGVATSLFIGLLYSSWCDGLNLLSICKFHEKKDQCNSSIKALLIGFILRMYTEFEHISHQDSKTLILTSLEHFGANPCSVFP
jgi:hypothetical protein